MSLPRRRRDSDRKQEDDRPATARPKMRRAWEFLWSALIRGALVVLPVYLVLWLLVRILETVAGLVHPIAALLPPWVPTVNLLALLLVVLVCLGVGLALQTATGRAASNRLELSVLGRLPGYSLFRSLTRQLAGDLEEHAWQPALAEIEEALVPAFVVEELDDGRCTVFVPSVPTPLAGTVYILTPERVHRIDVPFARAIRIVARWGSGSAELLAAMGRSQYAQAQKGDDGPIDSGISPR